METLWTIAISTGALVLVLGILVLTHELGHYLAAKLLGFGVEAFSVGMGPLLWQRKGKREAFQIRWLPLGGFVKLVGEEGDSSVPEGRTAREVFPLRKRWERFIVLVMGATFNILLSLLLFTGIARYGMEEAVLKAEAPRVGWVVPGSPGQLAGLLPGDIVVSIDGRDMPNWSRVQEEVLTLTEKPYSVRVRRGGEDLAFRLTPRVERIFGQEVGDAGLYPALPPRVGGVTQDGPAASAGLRAGDEIVALDDRPVAYWDQLQQSVAHGGPGPRKFSVRRSGAMLDYSVTPRWNAQAQRWMVGIEAQTTRWVQHPFPSCVKRGVDMVVEQSALLYRTLRKLVTAKMGMSSLSGPLGIAYIAGQAAQASTPIYDLLFLTASFSLQLGILNLLPIPVLDGGHIFILGIEGLVRRDLPERVKGRLLQAGLALLLILFGTIMVLDIFKFVP